MTHHRTSPPGNLHRRYFELAHVSAYGKVLPAEIRAHILVVGLLLLTGMWVTFRREAHTTTELAAALHPAVIIFTGTIILGRAYRAVQDSLVDIETMAGMADRVQLNDSLAACLSREVQDRIARPFAVVAFCITLALRPAASFAPSLIYALGSALGWLLNGYGLAVVIGVIRFINSLGEITSLQLAPLPAYTVGLRAASRLSGLLALLFAVQTAFETGIFFAIEWKSAVFVRIFEYGMMIPLGLVALAFFLHPQLVLARIVARSKKTTLLAIEQRLRTLGFAPSTASIRQYSEVSRLVEFHRRLTFSPSTPLDALTAIRFVPSFAVALAPLAKYAVDLPTAIRTFVGL